MEYTVIRSGRKTVAIQLNQDLTVTVRAPWRASKSEIERILQKKKPWIEKHLDQMRRRKEHYDASGTDKLTDEEIQELANKALKYIPERVAYFSKIIGVTYGRITIRNQKTRWHPYPILVRKLHYLNQPYGYTQAMNQIHKGYQQG